MTDRLNAVRLLSLDAHGRVLDWMSWQDAACLYARGAVALLAAAVMVHLLALSDAAWWQESRSATVLDAALQGLKPALPEKLASYLP